MRRCLDISGYVPLDFQVGVWYIIYTDAGRGYIPKSVHMSALGTLEKLERAMKKVDATFIRSTNGEADKVIVLEHRGVEYFYTHTGRIYPVDMSEVPVMCENKAGDEPVDDGRDAEFQHRTPTVARKHGANTILVENLPFDRDVLMQLVKWLLTDSYRVDIDDARGFLMVYCRPENTDQYLEMIKKYLQVGGFVR